MNGWLESDYRPEFHVGRISTLRAAIEQFGATVPDSIARAEQLLLAGQAFVDQEAGSVLSLTDDHVAENIIQRSWRAHVSHAPLQMSPPVGAEAGFETFKRALVVELLADVRGRVPDLIAEVRGDFDMAADVMVTAVQEFGFTYNTTANDVIDMDNPDAVRALRETRPAWRALVRIERGLRDLLAALDIATPLDPRNRAIGDPPDLSAYFAAGEIWSDNGGYHIEQRTQGGIDWFALAAGGLRLNTPSEVEAKISGRAA
ncbi:hypothetical protein [Cellulosimicrobium cellulans]|uniref:hypothetical protein n=1 Tax=Cellulosimicrobium cellulans TaxID=1710 RepID=UPI00130DB577|nr:hypothetical protein [Cellulosimicrobium cellulans]